MVDLISVYLTIVDQSELFIYTQYIPSNVDIVSFLTHGIKKVSHLEYFWQSYVFYVDLYSMSNTEQLWHEMWKLHWWMLICESWDVSAWVSFSKTLHQKCSVFAAVPCFIFRQFLTFAPGSYNYILLLLDTLQLLWVWIQLPTSQMDKLVRSSRVFVYSFHPHFPSLPCNCLQRPSVTILVFIYFVSFVPWYCSFLVGHESPACMQIYRSAPWTLYYKSHGLILFKHNAILSAVALESHAVTCDRMLNMVKTEHTGHLDTLKNKCKRFVPHQTWSCHWDATTRAKDVLSLFQIFVHSTNLLFCLAAVEE